jgi:hypothetical protein
MMKKIGVYKIKILACAAGILALAATSASAATLTFDQITANGATGGESQLQLDITDYGSARALFTFTVNSGTNTEMNVSEIYFDDRTPLFAPTFTDSQIVTETGVRFNVGTANPGNLPAGNNINFNTTGDLLADSDSGGPVAPGNKTGITVGDTFAFYLDFATLSVFADLTAAIDSGAFRIGLHVQSHLDGGSESYVNNDTGGGVTPPPPVVPLPAGMPLLLGAFGLLAVVRRKFSKAA